MFDDVDILDLGALAQDQKNCAEKVEVFDSLLSQVIKDSGRLEMMIPKM